MRAQGASNTGQGGTSSQAGHCKSAITFSASWYPPYRNLMMRGKLTCGGSGLGGKTITLTSTHVSYFGKIGTAVTAPDGSFSKSFKPVSTAKPLSTVSAWYLGGPDEGGISSKVISLGPPPWSVGYTTGEWQYWKYTIGTSNRFRQAIPVIGQSLSQA